MTQNHLKAALLLFRLFFIKDWIRRKISSQYYSNEIDKILDTISLSFLSLLSSHSDKKVVEYIQYILVVTQIS